MRWMLWGTLGAVVLVGGYLGLRVVGARRWARQSATLMARLDAVTDCTAAFGRVDLAQVDTLPPPVRRYLRLSLTDGQRVVTAVHLTHEGTFNQSLDTPRWSPFTSEQEVRTTEPGFVWNASIAMAPGMPVRVHDAFVEGEGVLRASLLGLVDVADQHGTPSLVEGELMRWLAESAWYPTALLPGRGVTWRSVSDTEADATITASGTTVTLRFTFGRDGLIAGVSSLGRMRAEGKREVRTPWEGRFWHYIEREGMRVPTEGEVGWRLPSGLTPYWRGTTVSATYTFME